jgi:hypothetical protein
MKNEMNPWPETRGSDWVLPAPIYLKALTSCRGAWESFLCGDLQEGLTFLHTGCVNP